MNIYDVTNHETLEMVHEFIDFIGENEKKGNSNIKSRKILVGNKGDLKEKKEVEKTLKILKEVISKTKMPVLECSAYENNGVSQCFEELARNIYTDVDFEAYEKQKAEQENNEQEEENQQEEIADPEEKKQPVKKKASGFFKLCRTSRRFF